MLKRTGNGQRNDHGLHDDRHARTPLESEPSKGKAGHVIPDFPATFALGLRGAASVSWQRGVMNGTIATTMKG